MNIDIYVLYQNINNPGRFIYGNVYSMFIINQEIRRNEIETKQTKRGERMKTEKEKIFQWIKENEFHHHQGGYLIHSDDLEVFIDKLFLEEEYEKCKQSESDGSSVASLVGGELAKILNQFDGETLTPLKRSTLSTKLFPLFMKCYKQEFCKESEVNE